MKLKTIKTNKEYESYLEWADEQFEKKVKRNSREGEILQVVLLLIKEYEDRNYPIPKPNPLQAIRIKMDEKGIKSKDLIGKIGSKGYISSILNGRKPLTLELAKIFHKELGVPAEVLLS